MKKIFIFIAVFVVLASVLSLNVFASDYYYDDSIDEDFLYDGIDEDFLYDGDDEYYAEYEGFNIVESMILSIVVGLVIALIVTGIMRSKMKSVRFERAARNYIRLNSMNVTRSHDMYLYSHISKRPKPQNNNKR